MHLLALLFLVLLSHLSTPMTISAQTSADLQRAIDNSTDRTARAKLYKQLGDLGVAQDKLEPAADAYLRALDNGRESFTPMERVQIAIYLSWADRLNESENELRALLKQEPKNLAARTQLARVLAWSGELAEGIAEANTVLRDSPEHKDALLVKADALQWQGRYIEAVPIYRKLVAWDGDFDARVGLSRSLLALGSRTEALENLHSLKANNGRQQRELAKLTEAVDQETRPTVDGRYNYYSDSDRNRLDRYSLTSGFWFGDQKLGFSFRHTEAADKTRSNRAEDLSLKTYGRLTDRISAGLGLGLSVLRDRHTSSFPSGHVRLDARVFGGTVGANLTREVVSDTAELIENRIRLTAIGVNFNQPITDRVSVSGNYQYKDFSDGNHANDLQLVSQYALYLSPRIVIGHRFRLLDFHKQSRSGFFDPNNYIANRAFASVYYEHRLFYTYLEGYVGYQTFRRNRVASDDIIHGGTGSVGIKPMANLAIEVNVEGGNFAAGSASGFNYLVIGPRVLFRF
jgi:tetratricopeptide (TPR) repeat protein